MAREILIINGHDWSHLIESKGYGWSRNDIDTDQTKRTKDGVLRRDKIGTKRKLTYTTRPAPRETLAQLDEDLSGTTFSATYTDLHGQSTRTFYCSSFKCGVVECTDAYETWTGAEFNLIEI